MRQKTRLQYYSNICLNVKDNFCFDVPEQLFFFFIYITNKIAGAVVEWMSLWQCGSSLWSVDRQVELYVEMCAQRSGPDYGITLNQISEVTVFVQLVCGMKLNMKKGCDTSKKETFIVKEKEQLFL